MLGDVKFVGNISVNAKALNGAVPVLVSMKVTVVVLPGATVVGLNDFVIVNPGHVRVILSDADPGPKSEVTLAVFITLISMQLSGGVTACTGTMIVHVLSEVPIGVRVPLVHVILPPGPGVMTTGLAGNPQVIVGAGELGPICPGNVSLRFTW